MGSVVLLKSLSSTVHLYLGKKISQPSVLACKICTMPSGYMQCVCAYSGKKNMCTHINLSLICYTYIPRLPCNSNVAMGTSFHKSRRSHMTGSTFLDFFVYIMPGWTARISK